MRENEQGVSPVIGVMLLLVVTIIIAAVVSGFSGSMFGNTEKAPELTMDVNIKNNGYWTGSSFSARVTGVDKAIPTKDIKIVTEWAATNYTDRKPISGGATVIPGINNTFVHFSPSSNNNTEDDYFFVSPMGYGTGVGMDGVAKPSSGHSPLRAHDKYFGNYSLTTGTCMWAEPFGKSSAPTAGGYEGFDVGYGSKKQWMYEYGQSTSIYYSHLSSRYQPLQSRTDAQLYQDTHTDQMQAVLGKNWENLRAGDVVTVTVHHIPSGKVIWQKNVVVEA